MPNTQQRSTVQIAQLSDPYENAALWTSGGKLFNYSPDGAINFGCGVNLTAAAISEAAVTVIA